MQQGDKTAPTGVVGRNAVTTKGRLVLILALLWLFAPAVISIAAGTLQNINASALLDLADWARPVTAPIIGLWTVPRYRSIAMQSGVGWPDTPVFGQPTAMQQVTDLWTGNISLDHVGGIFPASLPDWIKIHDLVITTDLIWLTMHLLLLLTMMAWARRRRQAQRLTANRQQAPQPAKSASARGAGAAVGLLLLAMGLANLWNLFVVTGSSRGGNLEMDRHRQLLDFPGFLFSSAFFFIATSMVLLFGIALLAMGLQGSSAKPMQR